ncbi:b(o/a)3-type cytochrome-c oxidase subunit 1 [Ammoniphilus resinae]|uniref:Cytochrome c oxidase subunit 1 n=1 Tax=Ammoniphilus resinae TaxID=861532 RepID=A0ABS4GN06_9BACL|nr:b(o/a)3-type cytochrome-c oxidase subunit 1 [Ammoniphilus resinae]MBP1931649.1 cytochrome c oxidase subunit 1 [Ammoniphilus resinae]
MNSVVKSPKDSKLSMSYLTVGFIAVFIGAICGLLQGLVRGGVIELPSFINYYQLLTAHGVLLALVFTTYFIYGLLFAGVSKTMGALSDKARSIGWIGFWVMTIGTICSTIMIILGEASVLYTFYAPLKAHPLYYIGLALVVVGSWIGGAAMLMHYSGWRKKNSGKLSPLFGYMTTATIILWIVCTIGVAISVLFQFIPWSFGWADRINVLLSRTLFWYFGHPLVYFWLLPAYIIWYVCIPKIIGGKVFSDSLARLSFVLFILFSIPVGFHHQLTESGIPEGWKFLQVVLTFMVITPSLMTAFSLFATFETTGREKGARGLFGWLKKLPYNDVRFFAPFMGMLFFIPGGAGGIVNASHQMNTVIHNTLWVVGHFHITVGTPVVLTFFGVTYWLVPYLTGRKLTPALNRAGMIQTILWSVGMFFMSTAMHILGLFGAPRRTAYSTYQDNPTALEWFHGFFAHYTTVALGGTILFIAAMMMVYLFFHLAFFAPKAENDIEATEFPIGEVAEHAYTTPRILENWKVWIGIVVVLILIAYTIPVTDMITHAPAGSPPIRTW